MGPPPTRNWGRVTGAPQHHLPPVLCAAPVPLPLPHHLQRGTLHGQQPFIWLLRGVSAARGCWEQRSRGMWALEHKQAISSPAAGSLVWLQARAGLSALRSLLPNVHVSIFSTSPESPDGSTFDCLVFASSSEQECEEIIRRIGKGRVYAFSQHHGEIMEYQELLLGVHHMQELT